MLTPQDTSTLAKRMLARQILSQAHPGREAIVGGGRQIIAEAGALMALCIEASGWITTSPDTPALTNALVLLMEEVYMAGVLVGRGQATG